MFSTLIDCNSLIKEIENPDWLIIDVRYDLMNKAAGKTDFEQGHIPGAVYLDLHADLSGPPVTNRGRHPLLTDASTAELFSTLGLDEKTQVVIYDDAGGSFAARLWWMCQHMQHVCAAVLDGGWQHWCANNGPIDKTVRQTSPSVYAMSGKTNDVVTISQVTNYERIIDSREPARYRGEFEPVDPAAGHIPGALNRCWKDNLQASGLFKQRDILRREFDEILHGTAAEEAVFYCGSGVTACHNLLAAKTAGLKLPKLYAGSWSEWSRTPGKPIATVE